jgi:hypothetical protein
VPQPPEVTSAADPLIAEYAAAADALRSAVAASKGSDSRRLAQVLRDLDAIMVKLDTAVRTHLTDTMPTVFRAGATDTGLGFAWDQASAEAVQALAAQDYSELLDATRHVTEATKRALRTLARQGALDVVVDGQTANAAGLGLTNTVQDALGQVMTVTYSNGAEHSLADWADTAVRTQTAKAYNAGALHQFRTYGVEWVEIADGSACGLTYHDDPELANGLVVPLETAQAYPLSHPRCARSLLPRVDLTSKTDAAAANDARDMDALNAMALDERQRAARATVTGRRMTVQSETRRVARRARAARTPR